jgi:RNA polymerase sigma factor (sigma-70 family)
MNPPHQKAAATLPLVRCAIYTRKSTEQGRKHRRFTPPQASKQPSPTDPVSVWNQSQRILFAVAHQVRRAIRVKLDGHGRAEAEPEELVNDAFIAVMEALPRFNPAAAQFTTFVYGLARRRMWLVARACFFGVSPEQMHRMDTAQRTPRYHRTGECLRIAQPATADAEERPSVRLVARIRDRLPRADRCLLDLFVQEGGNYAAVARRLGRGPERVRRRFCCLFRRIRAAI